MPTERTTPARILVVGDLATDVLAVPAELPDAALPMSGTDWATGGGWALGSDTPARIHITAGGSAANTATWLAGTGTPVTLVAAVGADAAGRARVAELTAAGVDCALQRTGGSTATVVVLSGPMERTMLCDRAANRLLTSEHVASVVAGTPAGHLHLSAYPLFDPQSRPAARTALTAARAAGMSTSVDAASAGPLREVGPAAFARWVGRVDLLLANLDEARVLLDDPTAEPASAARALLELAAQVVVKLGAQGALCADTDGVTSVPALPVAAVDVTGAGDAFAAGFLAARSAGAGPDAALRAGAVLGARAVGVAGARPQA